MLLKITDGQALDERKLMDVYAESNLENTDFFCPEEPGGFAREIHEASACVEAGKWFSETFSPEMSLALIGLMDEIRKDWKRTEEA